MWLVLWRWLKKHLWKIVLFPLGIVAGAAAVLALVKKPTPEPDPDFTDPGSDAIDAAVEAGETRDEKLEELATAHGVVLDDLTDDQRSELKELQDSPNEEVVAWFNRLR